MASDNTGLIVGGVIALGGIGFGIYEWYQAGQTAKKSKELTEKVTQYEALVAQLNIKIDDYMAETNRVIAKFNNAMAKGGAMTPEEEADLEAEKAVLIQTETDINALQDELERLRIIIDGLVADLNKPAPTLPGWMSLGSTLLSWGFITKIGVVVGIGYFTKTMIDRWGKGGGTGGSSGTTIVTLPNGHVVTGANSDQVDAKVKQYLLETSPVLDVSAMVVALPSVRDKFSELPLWVQDAIAADAGILEWYEQPNWAPYLRETPSWVYALMTALVVLAACYAISLPALWATTETVPATITITAQRLAPAFAW